MSENIEVRKIPKKHIILILILIVFGLGYYMVSQYLKEKRLQEILATLGHQNIENITIFKRHQVEDPGVKKQGRLYSLKFYDKDLQKECRGFVLQDYKNEFSKDIECK